MGDSKLPWAVWYPLRRTGAFARLGPKEQGAILREHGVIGRAYGEAGLGHDIRLACNGLDQNDNDFVIGLIGPDLYPLSHLVQAMRKTIQTSEYIEKLGPFFVGRACWQHAA
jgi:chlorite dismutase